MRTLDVRITKKRLSLYRDLKEKQQRLISDLEIKRQIMLDSQNHAIQYDRTPGGGGSHGNVLLSMIDEQSAITARIDAIRRELNYLDKVLDLLPDWCKKRFLDGVPAGSIANEMRISRHSLDQRLNSALRDIDERDLVQ